MLLPQANKCGAEPCSADSSLIRNASILDQRGINMHFLSPPLAHTCRCRTNILHMQINIHKEETWTQVCKRSRVNIFKKPLLHAHTHKQHAFCSTSLLFLLQHRVHTIICVCYLPEALNKPNERRIYTHWTDSINI